MRWRILLTNTSLAHRTGSELYAVELALALRARGHDPVVYSPALGGLAVRLAAASVAAVDDLAAVAEPPDLIHGHHHAETLTALLHFPGVPGLFVCHGWEPWEEAPPRFPRLLRHVAVDLPTRERLAAAGVPAERVETILNFVDLSRFRPRPPLPPRPRRALLFSNNAHEGTHLPAVRAACAAAGIELDVAGLASGRVAERPEELLAGYDLVFAKARAALEALAVGAAVVLCDAAGCGPMVTAGELDRLRPLNLGFRALDRPLSVEALSAQIARYDRDDAAAVSRRVREEAGLDRAVDRYIALYERILAEHRASRAAGGEAGERSALLAESRAAAAYLRWLSPYLKERGRALLDRDELWRRVRALEAERDRLLAEPRPSATEPPPT
jgi:glycosyltransferase involved in cell wall biosynthesis